MSKQLFIRRGTKVVGPITTTQVKQSIAAGKVLNSDQISESQEGPWHLVEKVVGLANSSEIRPTDAIASDESVPANPIAAVEASREVSKQRNDYSLEPFATDPLGNEDVQQGSQGDELLAQGMSQFDGGSQSKWRGSPQKGMALRDGDLLPGERHVKTKFANMVISVKESGLSRFAFDDCMGLVGMKGKEAIGGKAHLTNYRIIFKSHFFNRVRGTHSIFLPNVVEVSAKRNNLVVDTTAQHFQFVMWFKKAFVDAVKQEKSRIDEAGLVQLKKAILSNPEVIGAGLQKWVSLEAINQVFLAGRKPLAALTALTGTEKNAFIEIIELFQPE